jgi:signal transduction histidine kinase
VAARLGFWDWDVLSGRYQYGGDWSNLLSFPEDYFKPTLSPWEALLHPEDALRVTDILRSNLEGKTPEFEAECRLKTGTDEFVWVSARGRVIERDQNGLALRHVGVVEDIDERRKVREQLKAVARQKDEFLATLAHELRNPLAPIRTGLAIVKRDPTSDAARRARDMMERQLLQADRRDCCRG